MFDGLRTIGIPREGLIYLLQERNHTIECEEFLRAEHIQLEAIRMNAINLVFNVNDYHVESVDWGPRWKDENTYEWPVL